MFGFTNNQEAKISCRIIDMMDDAVIVIDKNQTIIMYNGAAEKIFGYPSNEIIGHSLDQLIPEQFRSHHHLLVDEFGQSQDKVRPMGSRTKQTFGLRKNREEFPTDISILDLGTSSNGRYAAIIKDISEDKKTEDELIRLAATDPLTGAYNRREFRALCERESMRSRRYGRPLSLLMLDLDHFKKLNDNYGHAAGDKALQTFTNICIKALRNVDIFGRHGGEEFVVLLPETDAEGAAIMAERLRKLTEAEEMERHGQKFNMTVSVGVTQFRDNEVSLDGPDGPLDRADSAVYEAKRAGRNTIAVYREK